MKKLQLLVINGPNLGMLGLRQPEIYGHLGIDALPDLIQKEIVSDYPYNIDYFQSNHEGAMIDRLEQAYVQKIDAIILNAGALTHTSLALADCLAWIKIPTVEVHISNILSRSNSLRQKSLIGKHVVGVIAGFGINSYIIAIQAILLHLKNTQIKH